MQLGKKFRKETIIVERNRVAWKEEENKAAGNNNQLQTLTYAAIVGLNTHSL